MVLNDEQMRAVKFQRPGRIPVRVNALPAVWKLHRMDFDAIYRRHPGLFPGYQSPDFDNIPMGDTYHVGDHVDEWGCVWSNLHDGMEAIVTGHPLPTRESVRNMKPPKEVKPWLKHGFMYLRLGDLRGFEEIMMDFAEDAPELQMLIDVVFEHNMQRLELMNKTIPVDDMYWFGDDLGMQTGLAMGADKWRRYMKPCFMKMYQYWRSAGRLVYFHTDGCIWEIIPDLVECGVQVVNAQYRANGIDNLARACKGKVCIDLDLDRQLMPFCSPRDIEAHVEECVRKLWQPEGGLWLEGEIGPDMPLENVDALFGALERWREYRG